MLSISETSSAHVQHSEHGCSLSVAEVAEIVEFRLEALGESSHPALIRDEWDESSVHLCLRDAAGGIRGSVRITPVQNGLLPFNDLYPVCAAQSDLELGRLVVRPEDRHGRVALRLVFAAFRSIAARPGTGRVWVDPLIGGRGRIDLRWLEASGFERLSEPIEDPRYNRRSVLLCLSADKLAGIWLLRDAIVRNRQRGAPGPLAVEISAL